MSDFMQYGGQAVIEGVMMIGLGGTLALTGAKS